LLANPVEERGLGIRKSRGRLGYGPLRCSRPPRPCAPGCARSASCGHTRRTADGQEEGALNQRMLGSQTIRPFLRRGDARLVPGAPWAGPPCLRRADALRVRSYVRGRARGTRGGGLRTAPESPGHPCWRPIQARAINQTAFEAWDRLRSPRLAHAREGCEPRGNLATQLRRAMVRPGRDRLTDPVEVAEMSVGGVEPGGGKRHVGVGGRRRRSAGPSNRPDPACTSH